MTGAELQRWFDADAERQLVRRWRAELQRNPAADPFCGFAAGLALALAFPLILAAFWIITP